MILDCLGTAFVSRFERLANITDIDSAIFTQKEAVDASAKDDIHKPGYLSNLGSSLGTRFERTGDPDNIAEAILVHQQAISLTPRDHATRPEYLSNLANSFSTRFQSDFGDLSDIRNAIAFYREAALSPTGRPIVRLRAAHHWAQLSLAGDSDSYSSPALEAYGVVMDLIQRAVWLGRTVHQRYQDISLLGMVVNEATAAACACQRYDLAVEWFEQGRSIVWGQILQLRTPLDKLEDVNAALASQLKQVAQDLEDAGTLVPGSKGAEGMDMLSLEEATQVHHILAAKWDSLVSQARSIPGFHDFLMPKKLAEIKAVAQTGCIIVINIHRRRCDALILRENSSQIDHVPLLQFSYKKAEAAQMGLLDSLKRAGVRERGMRQGSGEPRGDIFEAIMSMLWLEVAKPILEHAGYIVRKFSFRYANSLNVKIQQQSQYPENPPPITWCLTGPMAFLPLHAAGHYTGDAADPRSRVFNYAVSSYTPSLTALHKPQNMLSSEHRVLAVTQSATPGHTALPGTITEVDQVQQQITDHCFTRLDGERATVRDVTQAMDEHAWVHLACHAMQNSADPSASAFLLHDGRLELRSIMKKKLRHAELAFLSACQTATGEETLPEEAIHLAAGMFIAGYRAVVATMWSIRDDDAPRIAEAFYLTLLGSEKARTADALHWAVAMLREEVGEKSFMSWVPFIHIGY